MIKKILYELRFLYSLILVVNIIIVIGSYGIQFVTQENFNQWYIFSSGVVLIYGIFLFVTLLSLYDKRTLKTLIIVSFYLFVSIMTLTLLLSPVKVPVMSFVGSVLMIFKFNQIENLKNDV